MVGRNSSLRTALLPQLLTMSSTAFSDDVKQANVAREALSLDPVNEYEDAEKNWNPKSIKFWSIMIGMYLSFFLVGLVSNIAWYSF